MGSSAGGWDTLAGAATTTGEAAVATAGVGARIDDRRERCADVERLVADGHEQLTDHAVVEDLHFHVGLVGLDDGNEITAVHGVAGLYEPLDEPALGHVGAERRHAEHARISHRRSPAVRPRRLLQ